MVHTEHSWSSLQSLFCCSSQWVQHAWCDTRMPPHCGSIVGSRVLSVHSELASDAAADFGADAVLTSHRTEYSAHGANRSRDVDVLHDQTPTTRTHDACLIRYEDALESLCVDEVSREGCAARWPSRNVSANGELLDVATADILAVHLDGHRVVLRGGQTYPLECTQASTTLGVRHLPHRFPARSFMGQGGCLPDVVSVDEENAGNDKAEDGDVNEDGGDSYAKHHQFPTARWQHAGGDAGETVLPMYSTRWRHLSCVTLDEEGGRLHRIRHSGLYGDHTLSVLSDTGLSLVDMANEGASLCVVRQLLCHDTVSMSAVCFDLWTHTGAVVGFSDGSLSLYDWRVGGGSTSANYRCQSSGSTAIDYGSFASTPLVGVDNYNSTRRSRSVPDRNNNDATAWSTAADDTESTAAVAVAKPVLSVAAPQPSWLQPLHSSSLYRHTRSRVANPVAPVLSCCALSDNFRVVCGLGDPHGVVAIADLRNSSSHTAIRVPVTSSGDLSTTSSPKRHRRSVQLLSDDAMRRELLLHGSSRVVTGHPVCDVQHCRERFGWIGLVDAVGKSCVTTIHALENGHPLHLRGLYGVQDTPPLSHAGRRSWGTGSSHHAHYTYNTFQADGAASDSRCDDASSHRAAVGLFAGRAAEEQQEEDEDDGAELLSRSHRHNRDNTGNPRAREDRYDSGGGAHAGEARAVDADLPSPDDVSWRLLQHPSYRMGDATRPRGRQSGRAAGQFRRGARSRRLIGTSNSMLRSLTNSAEAVSASSSATAVSATHTRTSPLTLLQHGHSLRLRGCFVCDGNGFAHTDVRSLTACVTAISHARQNCRYMRDGGDGGRTNEENAEPMFECAVRTEGCDARGGPAASGQHFAAISSLRNVLFLVAASGSSVCIPLDL